MADLETEYLRRVNEITAAPIPYQRKSVLLSTLKQKYQAAQAQQPQAAPQFPTGEFEVGGMTGRLMPSSASSTGTLSSKAVLDADLAAKAAAQEANLENRISKSRTSAGNLAAELASQIPIQVLPSSVNNPSQPAAPELEIPVQRTRPARPDDLLAGSVPKDGVMYFSPLPDGTVPQANVPLPVYREFIDQIAISRGEEGSPWDRAERQAAERGRTAILADRIGVSNPYEIPNEFAQGGITSIGRTDPALGYALGGGMDVPLYEQAPAPLPAQYTPQQEAALNELKLREADLNWQMRSRDRTRPSYPIGMGYPIPPSPSSLSDYQRNADASRQAIQRQAIQAEREAITKAQGALDATTALAIFNEALEQTNGDKAKAAELARQLAKERGYSW